MFAATQHPSLKIVTIRFDHQNWSNWKSKLIIRAVPSPCNCILVTRASWHWEVHPVDVLVSGWKKSWIRTRIYNEKRETEGNNITSVHISLLLHSKAFSFAWFLSFINMHTSETKILKSSSVMCHVKRRKVALTHRWYSRERSSSPAMLSTGWRELEEEVTGRYINAGQEAAQHTPIKHGAAVLAAKGEPTHYDH